MSGARFLSTAEGHSDAQFNAADWGQIGLVALIWGSSYLWISIGVDSFAPMTVAMLRIAFGFATLSLFPAARSPIEPADRRRLALLALIWQGIPLSLYPIAEQWISSSVAGMLNGALPVLVAGLAAILLRRLPGRNQMIGMALGLVGVVCIAVPSWQGGPKLALGVVLVLIALSCYAVAANISVPLTQKYGALRVQWSMQRMSLLYVSPFGLWGLRTSHFEWSALGAVAVLGVFGTGLAFLLAARVFARVGATRGAAFNYLIPVVSIVLGVLIRDDVIAPLAVIGTGLVLAGAVFCSRAGR
jgi:drug/metabolite transporter (DMT)-like permease